MPSARLIPGGLRATTGQGQTDTEQLYDVVPQPFLNTPRTPATQHVNRAAPAQTKQHMQPRDVTALFIKLTLYNCMSWFHDHLLTSKGHQQHNAATDKAAHATPGCNSATHHTDTDHGHLLNTTRTYKTTLQHSSNTTDEVAHATHVAVWGLTPVTVGGQLYSE
jgi:hypothetical protein